MSEMVTNLTVRKTENGIPTALKTNNHASGTPIRPAKKFQAKKVDRGARPSIAPATVESAKKATTRMETARKEKEEKTTKSTWHKGDTMLKAALAKKKIINVLQCSA